MALVYGQPDKGALMDKKIVYFPTRQNELDDEAFERASEGLEKRLGVSVFEYLFESDKPEVQNKIQKALAKETLAVRTRLVEERFKRGIASNRRSSEVEGITVDPVVDELSLRQFKNEITGDQARRELLRALNLDLDLLNKD